MMPTLIVDDHIPFIKGVLEPYAKVIYAKGGVIDRGLASQADGLIIRTRTRCDKNLLEGTPVKFIATATIGTDHIDIPYCNSLGIRWYHAPGCNAGSVKQYVASVLANISVNHNFSLKNKKIGIIGAGHVGTKVAHLAEILGMTPLLNDPPRERNEESGSFVSIDEISESCDIISFHVPLNHEGVDKTFHMADKSFLEKLKNKPFIINTSRGEVIESEAIKEALVKGWVSGFVADVWENEPNADPSLLQAALIATPHIAGYSAEGKANGTAACVRAAGKFFGFGLDCWFPTDLPSPENPQIEIDASGKNEEAVLSQAILAGYDVMSDDQTFRTDFSQFENLRNHYPTRREFEAYNVKIKNSNPAILTQLTNLGFHINQ